MLQSGITKDSQKKSERSEEKSSPHANFFFWILRINEHKRGMVAAPGAATHSSLKEAHLSLKNAAQGLHLVKI